MDYKRYLLRKDVISADEAREKRSSRFFASREDKRFKVLEERRTFFVREEPQNNEPHEKKKMSRAELLQIWKAEKQKKIQQLMKTKKPVFKVGVVHYNANGDVSLRNITNKPNTLNTTIKNKTIAVTKKPAKQARKLTQNEKKKPAPAGVITRNMKKNQANVEKENVLSTVIDNQMVPVTNHIFKVPANIVSLGMAITIPHSPKITKSARKTKSFIDSSVPQKIPRFSLSVQSSSLSVNALENCQDELIKETSRLTVSVKKDDDSIEKANSENEKLKGESVINPRTTRNKKIGPHTILKTGKKSIKHEDIPESKPSRPQRIRDSVVDCSNKLESEKLKNENIDVTMTAAPLQVEDELLYISYSPHINRRRGSSGASSSGKKSKKVMGEQERCEQEILKEDIKKKNQIFSFRKRLENEKSDLLSKCESWKEVNMNSLPSDICGEINVVIGKTQMLTSDKFEQFRKLIDDCEAGDEKVRLDDLQGFWDWVHIDVDKMHDAFHKLEELKQNDWKTVEKKTVKEPPKKATVAPGKKTTAKTKAPAGQSKLKEFMKAMRVKKQETDSDEVKVFDGCFFKVQSPVSKTPRKSNSMIVKPDKRESLRENVLNSQLQCATILAATSSAKKLTPMMKQSSETRKENVSYINMKMTPQRSILKTPSSVKHSNSAKSVNFVDPAFRISEKYYTKLSSLDSTGDDSFISVDQENSFSLLPTPTRTTRSSAGKQLDFDTPARRSKRLACRNGNITPVP